MTLQFWVTVYKFVMVWMLINFTLETVVGCTRSIEECKHFLEVDKSYIVLPGAWVACKLRTW